MEEGVQFTAKYGAKRLCYGMVMHEGNEIMLENFSVNSKRYWGLPRGNCIMTPLIAIAASEAPD